MSEARYQALMVPRDEDATKADTHRNRMTSFVDPFEESIQEIEEKSKEIAERNNVLKTAVSEYAPTLGGFLRRRLRKAPINLPEILEQQQSAFSSLVAGYQAQSHVFRGSYDDVVQYEHELSHKIDGCTKDLAEAESSLEQLPKRIEECEATTEGNPEHQDSLARDCRDRLQTAQDLVSWLPSYIAELRGYKHEVVGVRERLREAARDHLFITEKLDAAGTHFTRLVSELFGLMQSGHTSERVAQYLQRVRASAESLHRQSQTSLRSVRALARKKF